MAGPYELFKNDENLETKGVELDYGDFRITVARAGGTNKKFPKTFEAKTRPYRRAIAAGTLDPEVDRKVMAEVYADSVVLGWARNVKNEDGSVTVKNGVIPGPDGEDIPFTKANVIKLFMDLPDLFADVVEQAGKIGLFREDEKEVDAKN